VILCLVLLGLANILGALSSSFSLLFATRILAGIGAGGVFPISLGLTSDLVGRTGGRSRSGNAGGVDDRQSARGLAVGLIGDFSAGAACSPCWARWRSWRRSPSPWAFAAAR